MIEQSTFQFLKDLKSNNNRDWFNDNRKAYEAATDNSASFIEELIVDIQEMDSFITDATAKNSVFRIFKDVRFSKNKDPYKTHFGAAISKGGRKSEYSGYYIHVEPDNKTMVASGIWHLQAPVLKSVRNEIAFNQEQYEKIINNKAFKSVFGAVTGDRLVRPPKGFDKDHSAVEHLKHKDFVVQHTINDKEVCKAGFKDYLIDKYKIVKPFSEFFRGPAFDVLEKE